MTLRTGVTLAVVLAAAGCGNGEERAVPSERVPTLTRLFRVDSLHRPESVAWDSARGRYLVTNVADGDEGEARGFVTTVAEDGSRVRVRAIGGGRGARLDQPRGIAVRGDRAWIADLHRVVGLDLTADTALFYVPIPESRLLNDVAVDASGDVYVSDTSADALFRLPGGEGRYERVAAPGSLRGPNGLLAAPGGVLLVAGWEGALVSLNPDSSVTLLAEAPELEHLDGLQRAPDGGLLVTDFAAGHLQRLERRSELVWRTGVIWLSGLEGPADFLVRDRILALPELDGDRVTFYRVEPDGSG